MDGIKDGYAVTAGVKMRSFDLMDPAKILEFRGEDCSNCKHLASWKIGGNAIKTCDNMQIPEHLRARAPKRRCFEWKHIKQEAMG